MTTTGPQQPPRKPGDAPEQTPEQDAAKTPDTAEPAETPEKPAETEAQPAPVNDAAAPAEVTPDPVPDPDDDWWNNFAQAVEDPNVSIYEYLRNHAMSAMDLDNKEGAPSAIVQAREAALKELFALKNPEELSKKLASMENNLLLFNANARAVMKVSRAVLDTYIRTRSEVKDGQNPDDMGAAIGANLKQELTAAQDDINPALASVAGSLKNRDEQEIASTIRKAAAQMGEERNVTAMMRDTATFVRKYMSPDNVVNIAILALPLVTWQYRWALAAGLGVYAGRHSLRHGYKALAALYHGDRVEARAQGRDMLSNLKSAGGSVLLIALSPVLAKYPLVAAGFLGFAIEAMYHKTIDTFNKMLAEEESAPGSTPIGRRIKKGLTSFFGTYQDKLGALAARTLKILAPHTATDAVEALSKRLPLSKMRKVASRTWMVTGALSRRFNRMARAKAHALREDVVDLGRDFLGAIEGALSDAAAIATRRDAEMIAERLLMEARAREMAAEEARQAALREEEQAYAEGADDGMTQNEEVPATATDNAAADSEAAEQARAQELKKHKLRALSRAAQHHAAQNRARTMQARPD